MINAAKVLSTTAIDPIKVPGQIEAAKKEFNPENSTDYSIQWAAKC